MPVILMRGSVCTLAIHVRIRFLRREQKGSRLHGGAHAKRHVDRCSLVSATVLRILCHNR